MSQQNLGSFSKAKYLPGSTTHCGFCLRTLKRLRSGISKKYLIHGAGTLHCKVGNKVCLLGEIKFFDSKYACSNCYDDNRNLLKELEQEKKTQTEQVPVINIRPNWNFGSRYIFVSMTSLFCLLDFILHLTPADLISAPTVSYIGSVISITFLLVDKTKHVWYSSPKTMNSNKKRGVTSFDLNSMLPLAANLVGGKPSTIYKFLELMNVRLRTPSVWRYIVKEYLNPVVAEEWKQERARVNCEMNSCLCIKLQEDEQHSRPQRNGSLGHSPYVTVTVIWAAKKLVCALEHVNRSAKYISSAAACELGRAKAFCYIAQELSTNLLAIVTDACTSAGTSVKRYLISRWPQCSHSHDLWHKTRKWTMGLSDFCSKRPYPHARTYLYQHIYRSWSDGELLIGKLKRHFVFCAHMCDDSRGRFIQLFANAADHYGETFDWPEIEIQAFRDWLTALVEKDAEYFIHGLQTSATESFHNVCNVYCVKGVRWGFESYCMRKNLAALHWNTKQRGGKVKEMRSLLMKKILCSL